MLPLVFLLLDTSLAPIPDRIQTHNLGKLAFHDAQTLSGSPVRVVFTVDSLADVTDGELDLGQRVEVEGLLRTRVVPGRLIDGVRFEAVNEVEVMGARPVSRP